MSTNTTPAAEPREYPVLGQLDHVPTGDEERAAALVNTVCFGAGNAHLPLDEDRVGQFFKDPQRIVHFLRTDVDSPEPTVTCTPLEPIPPEVQLQSKMEALRIGSDVARVLENLALALRPPATQRAEDTFSPADVIRHLKGTFDQVACDIAEVLWQEPEIQEAYMKAMCE